MTSTRSGTPAATTAAGGPRRTSKGWGTPAYRTRYELDRLHGRPRVVDATPTRAHVKALARRGVPVLAIGTAAGVSGNTVQRILDGTSRRILATTAQALAAVTYETVAGRRTGYVPIVGSRRRVQALMALGWTHRHITAAMVAAGGGSGSGSIDVLAHTGMLTTVRTAAAVRAAFDALSGRLGPSTRTRTRARNAGYAPPLAWDDHAIDDPRARPRGVEAAAPRRTA